MSNDTTNFYQCSYDLVVTDWDVMVNLLISPKQPRTPIISSSDDRNKVILNLDSPATLLRFQVAYGSFNVCDQKHEGLKILCPDSRQLKEKVHCCLSQEWAKLKGTLANECQT